MIDDEDKIIENIKRFLEEKKGLNVNECMKISKEVFDDYFEQNEEELFSGSDSEVDDFEDDVDDFEDDDAEDVPPVPGDHDYEPKKVVEKKKELVFANETIPIVDAKKPLVSEEDIDDGNF